MTGCLRVNETMRNSGALRVENGRSHFRFGVVTMNRFMLTVVLCLLTSAFATLHTLFAHCPNTTTNKTLCIGQWAICSQQKDNQACLDMTQQFAADNPQTGNWSCKDNGIETSECIVAPFNPPTGGLKTCNLKGSCKVSGNDCAWNDGAPFKVVSANYYIVLACDGG